MPALTDSTAGSVSRPGSVAIIGAGPAGFSAAAELRQRGFAGRIQLVDPAGPPHDRPPLSKAYLAGALDESGIALAAPGWFSTNAVELVAERAVGIAPDEGKVVLAGGSELQTDVLLLATGGTARELRFPGAGLIHTLRTKADADTLRAHLGPGRKLVIIGAGLIGAETASTAAALGTDVVLIDPVPVPLVPAVGLELAAYLHRMHSEAGIRTITGLPVDVVPEPAGPSVVLDDGSIIDADAVLAAIGMVPDTDLAAAAGIAVGGGVLVDAAGRTSHPRVFAAGDSARRSTGGVHSRRSEHWDAAVRSGRAAAAGILGQDPGEDAVPWFWTDRHGIHAEAVGSMDAEGQTVERGSPGPGYLVFRLTPEGTLAGAAGIDAGNVLRAVRRLIALKKQVSAEQLADPGTDLRRLARSRG